MEGGGASGRGGLGDGGVSRAEIVAMVVHIVGVHLREQEGVDQDRDKNDEDEQVRYLWWLARPRCVAVGHRHQNSMNRDLILVYFVFALV
jgi:hypothetical protein